MDVPFALFRIEFVIATSVHTRTHACFRSPEESLFSSCALLPPCCCWAWLAGSTPADPSALFIQRLRVGRAGDRGSDAQMSHVACIKHACYYCGAGFAECENLPSCFGILKLARGDHRGCVGRRSLHRRLGHGTRNLTNHLWPKAAPQMGGQETSSNCSGFRCFGLAQ